MDLRKDAFKIIEKTIESCLPNNAVKKALQKIDLNYKRIYLVAIGKAAYSMAEACEEILSDKLTKGIVITKYGHVKGILKNIDAYEAGHPISDENTFLATQKVLDMVKDLTKDDLVLFLVSGGGSALFEDPLIDPDTLKDVNRQLLESGASITEINTIRKRLSKVKGGKFALLCSPAHIESIILSDIIGDPLDMIASGPAYPDSATSKDALEIVEKYSLDLDEYTLKYLKEETPKDIANVNNIVTGSVRELCLNASDLAGSLGYDPIILTDTLDCEARHAGAFMASIAKTYRDKGPKAFVFGGETVVTITGPGLGGRNQEIALSAAEKIAGLDNIVIFSVGSDGTDGPTDAAGGIVDGSTCKKLSEKGLKIYEVLKDNDSYHALKMVDGLVMTGSTGTNVNDFSVVLIK